MTHEQTQLRTSASLLAHGGQALKHGNKIDHQTPFFISSLLARITARPFYSTTHPAILKSVTKSTRNRMSQCANMYQRCAGFGTNRMNSKLALSFGVGRVTRTYRSPTHSISSGGSLLPLPDGKAGDHVLRIASQILHPSGGPGIERMGPRSPQLY